MAHNSLALIWVPCLLWALGSLPFDASFEETSFSLESWTDSAFWLCMVSHVIWVLRSHCFWDTHRGSTLLIGAVSTPFGCLGDTLHESLRQQVGIADTTLFWLSYC